MEKIRWEDDKEKRKNKALAVHFRLSRMFKEDRLSFERERRRLIEELIEQAPTDQKREKLRSLQDEIDKRLRGAGSGHNRFVLMQNLFWNQVAAFRETIAKL
jgi:hypothetical protein